VRCTAESDANDLRPEPESYPRESLRFNLEVTEADLDAPRASPIDKSNPLVSRLKRNGEERLPSSNSMRRPCRPCSARHSKCRSTVPRRARIVSRQPLTHSVARADGRHCLLPLCVLTSRRRVRVDLDRSNKCRPVPDTTEVAGAKGSRSAGISLPSHAILKSDARYMSATVKHSPTSQDPSVKASAITSRTLSKSPHLL
jgi:hypothetical protein